MSRGLAFARFTYRFILGDDWLIAAGVAVAIGATALLANSGVAAWWTMPLAVIALLLSSVRRGSRRAQGNESEVR
jgi:hypothetical protein